MISATYPYKRVQDYAWLGGVQNLPKKICDYLLDLPQNGYTPPQTNDYPRVRLMKYLYYDTARPLDEAALTPQQKLSLVFDPYNPTNPPTGKGYRIFPLEYVQQAQTAAQTILRCYIGYITPRDAYRVNISVIFEILTSAVYENNTKSASLSRAMAIEQCLWEALNGVNMDGVGAFYSDRRQMPDCGSYAINDGRTNVGRRVTFGLTWADSTPPPNTLME